MARLITALTFAVGAWTLGTPAVAVAQETPPIVMTFDLYTTARAAHDGVDMVAMTHKRRV